MKLTTVLASVNENPDYYLFIPKQIIFWKKWGVRFLAVFVGQQLPTELEPYKDNIFLWKKNLKLHSVFLAQNLRIFYPALLSLPEDEMVMITDMDMLPTNGSYYKDSLENIQREDFVYYRNIDGNQIYMCYNAAHPKVWAKIFSIFSEQDIEQRLEEFYPNVYTGVPGGEGWFSDQEYMYSKLHSYPHLKVLDRPIKRLVYLYLQHLRLGHRHFIHYYDDCHFHRNYRQFVSLIEDAERQCTELVVS